jgi:F-type H+-transporting ATPase subunit epsilon
MTMSSTRHFSLQVIAPSHILYQGNATCLSALGAEGALGILAGHEPMVTPLRDGAIRFTDETGKDHSFQLKGGMLHITFAGTVIHAEEVVAAEA